MNQPWTIEELEAISASLGKSEFRDVSIDKMSVYRLQCVVAYMLNRPTYDWNQIKPYIDEIDKREARLQARMRMSSPPRRER